MFDEYEWIKEGPNNYDDYGAYLINKIEKYDNHYIIPFSKSFLDGINGQHNIIDNLQFNFYGMNIQENTNIECNLYALCYHYATMGEF